MLAAFKRAMRRMTPAEAAARELADAELALLEAQTGAEWAQAVVTYNRQRISRLKVHLATLQATAQTQQANA
jgi:hypothetical protein